MSHQTHAHKPVGLSRFGSVCSPTAAVITRTVTAGTMVVTAIQTRAILDATASPAERVVPASEDLAVI